MKTPQFWRRESKSVLPLLLAPAAWLYGAGSRLHRSMQRSEAVEVPVICVGNVVAGGAGKTPAAVAIAQLFIAEGKRPHFLTRGYGGRLKGPVRVVLDVHQFSDVGDEALILAETAPTWVAADRVAGARAAAKAGADVVIMDDGFQNPSLRKDFSLLVIDADYGVGNGRLLPAGPLRESLAAGLARSDAVILVGGITESNVFNRLNSNTDVFTSHIVPKPATEELSGEKVVAFAGIGRPEKFFETLKFAGCDLMDSFSYPDHHVYNKDEIMIMVERAAALEAALVTTRKDYVRLAANEKMMVAVFDVEMNFANPGALRSMLLSLLKTPAA
ncbi:tetraacyldisaccharide 4'-kinase [Sneathiella chungangensis]|uniref:Tetraacyldisaccharide 4'-kinase n=1 Tax=Sneathiella chungangensis TaxID=1418234 RepID=A0A845MEA3_9PROT|nr:tetraacyldisaccharide 4'-kinase [Sneathiella chungangensis]MZR21616.1 tetraacyldisaccharide 4'-kinase [Sneathiella chungangensis]